MNREKFCRDSSVLLLRVFMAASIPLRQSIQNRPMSTEFVVLQKGEEGN